MAAMLGRKGAWGERSCNCCHVGKDKRSWKRIERREWQRDQQP